jgi:hypothetical protein
LIVDVLALLNETNWRNSAQLEELLQEAFAAFYPDAGDPGFRPDAVDFFSTLKSYMEICAGFAGGFKDAPDLYRKLKFAIAHLLVQRLRDCDARLRTPHAYLDRVVQRGNVVITSNWDFAIERYAQLHSVPIRYSGTRKNELVVLKLHGSIDWTLGQHMKSHPDEDYSILGEQLFGHHYRQALPAPGVDREDVVFRIHALEHWNQAWSRLSSRTEEPYMITMARGKAGDLGPVEQVWRDAYGAVGRAKSLEIVGYSMPDDDTEIRTLLRSGVERGDGPDEIVVRNPSPDVHDRVRRYLERGSARSDYLPVNAA